jgi:hypothetical protein
MGHTAEAKCLECGRNSSSNTVAATNSPCALRQVWRNQRHFPRTVAELDRLARKRRGEPISEDEYNAGVESAAGRCERKGKCTLSAPPQCPSAAQRTSRKAVSDSFTTDKSGATRERRRSERPALREEVGVRESAQSFECGVLKTPPRRGQASIISLARPPRFVNRSKYQPRKYDEWCSILREPLV